MDEVGDPLNRPARHQRKPESRHAEPAEGVALLARHLRFAFVPGGQARSLVDRTSLVSRALEFSGVVSCGQVRPTASLVVLERQLNA